MQTAEVLELFEQTGALLSGHFELRSGLHSDSYFQCAYVLRYPRIAARLCGALAAEFAARHGDGAADCVLSPAMGGILVGHEVARALDLPSIFAEKQEGALVLRRFPLDAGTRVLVAEDVITRGGRVLETIDIAQSQGAEVVGAVLLVDRSGGKARFGCPTHSLVKMEPVTWEPDRCPLCADGIPVAHPGS